MATLPMQAFLEFTEAYRQYATLNGSPNPAATTHQMMQMLFENWSNTIFRIVQSCWQPNKNYRQGAVVWTPSLPAGCVAKCIVAGQSAGMEPSWPSAVGYTATDGAVTWRIIDGYPESLPANGGLAAKAQNSERLGGQAASYYASAAEVAAKAPLHSPELTGRPTVPTAEVNTNNTQIASTAFVMTALSRLNTSDIVAQSYGQNGYVKYKSGLILQWGSDNYNARTITVAYPLRFTQTPVVVANKLRTDVENFGPSNNPIALSGITTNKVVFGSNGDWGNMYKVLWVAVGF